MENTDVNKEHYVPRYSLGEVSKRLGLWGLKRSVTIITTIGLVIFVVANASGLPFRFGVFILIVTAVVDVLVTLTLKGRTIATFLRMLLQHGARIRLGQDVYLSGEMSKITGGLHRLPGRLARTYLVEGIDADGRPFAAIVDEPTHAVTVMFNCQMTGQTPVNQDERNLKTAEWAKWLSDLSLPGDVKHAAVVVAIRPGTGQLVAQEVESLIADGAPQVAIDVMTEMGYFLSENVPEIVAHIAVTFNVAREDLQENAFLEAVATRLPNLYQSLSWSGILAEPMGYEQVVGRVYQFFNPPTEPELEELEILALDHGLAWEDIGPGYARAGWDTYEHDGCTSITWEMSEAPRFDFEDTLLTNLFSPYPSIKRKRVVLVYRPFAAGKGVRKVEQEHIDALGALTSSKKKQKARDELRYEKTDQARQAQARGAQLGRYSLFVTATVTDREELKRVEHDVDQLGSGVSVGLRKMTMQQDTGFYTTLGVGHVPWDRDTTKFF